MQVLIVDDDMATVDVIRHTVAWEGLGIKKIYTSYNIDNAKKVLREQKIDIIISDIEMPQGSGLDLLEWLRQQELEGEFLLLTCHESFDYATNAVKLHAAEYLLKPFDVAIMEAALKKIIYKIQEETQLKENYKYGKWVKKNHRQMQTTFWNMIFTGHIPMSEREIKKEITDRNLLIDTEDTYYMVISKITNIEKDREKISPNLMLFVMENIHSELLIGHPENDSVISLDFKNYYIVISVCKFEGVYCENKCTELIKKFQASFTANITCCISNPCKVWEFYETFQRNLGRIEENIIYYGKYFRESQGVRKLNSQPIFLEFEHMQQFLNKKKKLEFMSYLKEKLQEKVRERTINEQMLKKIQQEILQVVYTYLGKKGIQATGLYMDHTMEELAQKSSQSVTDMIRFVNFLIEQTFLYEDEEQKKYTIIDKINLYIKEHYGENIGRTEIAAQFFLAPEYLSKMYKKQTGKSLKDYLSEYRIEQAKLLLERGERVSDVAEKVGFENFTYFSTMFKKYTGISPNQYRRK